ncbi:MAG: hypothetical protein HYS20_00445 [Rhodocyclales bacterium]|nr:hypothetical protein [Rhodocyclales bacterium]
MSQPDNSELQDAGLSADTDFKAPLKRVSYQPGMLLGLEATRAEQEYHRRHLNRHNYWLHGSGTVAGLLVDIRTVGTVPDDDTTRARIRLNVSPGIGVDGLGREITVSEPYCIDLGAWLTTQYEDKENNRWGALIRDGYDEKSNLLWLKVTMRYQESPSGLQPVMATDVNAGTDPVKPSRLQDGVLFELVAECPKNAPQGDHPFAAHNALPEWNDDLANKLSQSERDKIKASSGGTKEQLQLAARLLYALADDNEALAARGANTTTAAELGHRLARTLLARVAIRLTPAQELIVNPRRVTVDNLTRPFLFNAATLAQLIK